MRALSTISIQSLVGIRTVRSRRWNVGPLHFICGACVFVSSSFFSPIRLHVNPCEPVAFILLHSHFYYELSVGQGVLTGRRIVRTVLLLFSQRPCCRCPSRHCSTPLVSPLSTFLPPPQSFPLATWFTGAVWTCSEENYHFLCWYPSLSRCQNSYSSLNRVIEREKKAKKNHHHVECRQCQYLPGSLWWFVCSTGRYARYGSRTSGRRYAGFCRCCCRRRRRCCSRCSWTVARKRDELAIARHVHHRQVSDHDRIPFHFFYKMLSSFCFSLVLFRYLGLPFRYYQLDIMMTIKVYRFTTCLEPYLAYWPMAWPWLLFSPCHVMSTLSPYLDGVLLECFSSVFASCCQSNGCRTSASLWPPSSFHLTPLLIADFVSIVPSCRTFFFVFLCRGLVVRSTPSTAAYRPSFLPTRSPLTFFFWSVSTRWRHRHSHRAATHVTGPRRSVSVNSPAASRGYN